MTQISVPPACVEAMTHGVWRVFPAWRAALGPRARRCHDRPDQFAGGVKNQRVPQVARDGLIALPALACNGRLHRLGDSLRGFVKEDFQGGASLGARSGALNAEAQRGTPCVNA